MLCTIRGGAICKANGEGDVLQGSACSKIYSSQIPSRVFCTARSDRFSTVSTWLSTSCISQRFPATIYCGGPSAFRAFLRPACPTIELSEVLAAEERRYAKDEKSVGAGLGPDLIPADGADPAQPHAAAQAF
mgnify:CR=1 FL=1